MFTGLTPSLTDTIHYITLPSPSLGKESEPAWGWHLVLNLYECDPNKIRSAEAIEEYVIELCELIQMKRFGAPTIVDFGEDPRVSGYSLVQLIETSNICGHFANDSNAAYLDIFSCKKFDPELAAQFSMETFGARQHTAVFFARP